MKEQSQSHIHTIVEKTKEFIENHPDDLLTLDDIANHVNYSKFHLNRIFAEATGDTIHKYIQKQRLENASAALAQSDQPILDIAFTSGYQSQQAFTLAFKQHYGETPLLYRRKSRAVKNSGVSCRLAVAA